jgi:hypothetical protein
MTVHEALTCDVQAVGGDMWRALNSVAERFGSEEDDASEHRV